MGLQSHGRSGKSLFSGFLVSINWTMFWKKIFRRYCGRHQAPGRAANKMVFFLIEDAVATGTLASKLVRQATKWDGHGAFLLFRNGYVFNGSQTATILLAELSRIRLRRDEDASGFCLRLVELIEDLELVPGNAAVYLSDTQKLGYLSVVGNSSRVRLGICLLPVAVRATSRDGHFRPSLPRTSPQSGIDEGGRPPRYLSRSGSPLRRNKEKGASHRWRKIPVSGQRLQGACSAVPAIVQALLPSEHGGEDFDSRSSGRFGECGF